MKLKFAALLLFIIQVAHAQDIAFARKMVDTLTSPYFWGRGYTNNGVQKAAAFLSAQLKSYGVKPMNGKNYLQEFTYPINRFPVKWMLNLTALR